MIVKMKKVSLIVMDRHRESALSALRKIGIVHVESDPVSNEDIADLTQDHSGSLVIEVVVGSHDDYWIVTPEDIARNCGS